MLGKRRLRSAGSVVGPFSPAGCGRSYGPRLTVQHPGHELQETSPTHVSERSLLNYSKRILSASSRDSVQLNVDRILYKNVIYQFNAVINSAVFIAP